MTDGLATPPASLRDVEISVAAEKLRAAGELIDQYADDGRAKTIALRALGRMLAALEGAPALTCRTCCARFDISRTEAWFYRQQGLSLPTHCKACRAERRQKRAILEGKNGA